MYVLEWVGVGVAGFRAARQSVCMLNGIRARYLRAQRHGKHNVHIHRTEVLIKNDMPLILDRKIVNHHLPASQPATCPTYTFCTPLWENSKINVLEVS